MERKVCNNKVEFIAAGKSAVFHLSDLELRRLRKSSVWVNGDDWERFTHGDIYNFSVFTLFGMEFKSQSKRQRFNRIFHYHDFDKMYWYIKD